MNLQRIRKEHPTVSFGGFDFPLSKLNFKFNLQTDSLIDFIKAKATNHMTEKKLIKKMSKKLNKQSTSKKTVKISYDTSDKSIRFPVINSTAVFYLRPNNTGNIGKMLRKMREIKGLYNLINYIEKNDSIVRRVEK